MATSDISVAKMTNFPSIFGRTYWGSFKSCENPRITNHVIRNRNALMGKYQLGQRCQDSCLDDVFPSFTTDLNLWDHIECYYIRTTPNARLVVTSPYVSNQEEARNAKMEALGFSRIAPIYSESAVSFVRLFCSKRELELFGDGNRRLNCDDYALGNHDIPDHPVDKSYMGTIIYATPGSGKSELVKRCNFLIDADELLLAEIAHKYPCFEIDNTNHPGKNLLQFCRTYSRSALQPIYDAVGEEMEELARERGHTVLTGSLSLMHLADHVFIQTNGAIVRQDFDQDPEKNQALEMGKFIPIECYLEDILCYPFER